MKQFITSESVTEGHPDKIADQISDSILDEIYSKDPHARVAVEALTTTGLIVIAGEVTTNAHFDAQKIARNTLKEIGYNDPAFGIDHEDAGILVSITEQSPDIAQGVDEKDGEHGAGDQGMMYGYATKETKQMMPLPIVLAHRLTESLEYVRKNNLIEHLGPDGKSQVTVEYEDGKPKRVDAIVIAQQHKDHKVPGYLKNELIEHVIKPICGEYIDDKTKFHINATGRFVTGGPEGDTGLTGRKIIADTYGGIGRHGGGCFSGKDPSKVDRSGAYMARYIAKNIVAADLADKCEVQLSYAIGVAKPISIHVDCFGTGKIPEEEIVELIYKHFPLTPSGIINHLKLRRPIYRKTAKYGHFGREDPDFTWEKTDKAGELK